MPDYGKLNQQYFASVLERDEPGGPMWALNLMKYRSAAQYEDGRETTLTGQEADDAYTPTEQLAAVGARLIMAGQVVHQLVGDDTVWDRIGIAQYPTRAALIEMSMRDDFQEAHHHKEAGMDFTIVMPTFPYVDDPIPPQHSGVDDDVKLLLQVVMDPVDPEFAAEVDSVRVGRFWVEDRMIGDDRTFGEARFDLIGPAAVDELVARGTERDDASYVVIAEMFIDDVARSLTAPDRVLP